jgi:signal transduction histidine kinase
VEDITEKKIMERSKDEFFSIASHELRTPLTAIKGNTSMIMSYFPELLKDKDVKEMLSDIHTSSIRLIDIVNDFLDVSRIEQGKIVFKNEAFSIEKIIESVIYEMGPVLKEKKIYLKFDQMTAQTLPQVWSDADRTKQIIYNLIGNAAKFTEEGGVTVSAHSEAGFLKVAVTDTGRGIPLDKQELLFRKFQQAGNSLLTRDTAKGTGLGLYISKMLVERMGGHISLEKSEEGKGTTFGFTLPLATVEQRKATKDEQAKALVAEQKFTKVEGGPKH